MTEAHHINLVVAHAAEAKPLCEMLKLHPHTGRTPLPLFRNDRGFNLIVSGMGKLAAATATSYLAGMQAGSPECVWLNVGIAGHQQAAVGTGLLAHKVTEASSGQHYYPPQLIQGVPTSNVITVDIPETSYPDNAAYDMEAAGFCASASRFATSELVQVFKIVSDNPQHPVAHFHVSQVAPLIHGQQQQLRQLLQDLGTLLSVYRTATACPPAYADLLTRYHLTASQRVQLQRLCERYQALELQELLLALAGQRFADSKQLLGELEARLIRVVGN